MPDHDGLTPAIEFGPVKFKAIGAQAIQPHTVKQWRVTVDAAGNRTRELKDVPHPGWCRNYANRRQVKRIVEVFRWATSEELIPAATVRDGKVVAILDALRTVTALRKGKSEARETKQVKPAPDADVEAVLPHLGPTVRPTVFDDLPAVGAAPALPMSVCIVTTDTTPRTATSRATTTNVYGRRSASRTIHMPCCAPACRPSSGHRRRPGHRAT